MIFVLLYFCIVLAKISFKIINKFQTHQKIKVHLYTKFEQHDFCIKHMKHSKNCVFLDKIRFSNIFSSP